MNRLKRPSPALILAVIALVVAMGGTGYAALKLPKNSVGSKQIKSNAVSSSEVKDGSLVSKDFKAGQLPAGAAGPIGPVGPKGDKGDTGAPGAGATKLLGSIQTDGTMTRSQGITGVTHTGVGTYTIQFNRDVSACYPVANIYGTAGYVVMTGFAGDKLFVDTFDTANPAVHTNQAFYVAVFC